MNEGRNVGRDEGRKEGKEYILHVLFFIVRGMCICMVYIYVHICVYVYMCVCVVCLHMCTDVCAYITYLFVFKKDFHFIALAGLELTM